jgi:signal transduction histidine kinase/CheY-like chemotaxis protein
LAVAAQFSQIVSFSAMTLLLLLFAWLYVRDRRQRTLNWLQGWIAIEIHFAGNLLQLAGWISPPVADWLAYSTLFFAAASFFLSVSDAYLTKSARRVFWTLVFAPALAYVTLLVSGRPAVWIFDLISGVIFAASTWIFATRAKWKLASCSGCILLGAIPAAAVMFTTGDPSQGINVLLFDAFAVTGAAWAMHFWRATPGVILASVSFVAWGSVFIGAGLLARLGANIPDQSVLWDLPKYFVAFGMIITLLEEETKALQQEVRDRRQAENALRESAFFLGESQRIAQLGTYTFDISSGSCKMSAVARHILGIQPDADIDANVEVPAFIDLLSDRDREEFTRRLGEPVFTTGERFEREIVISRKIDGAERSLHVRAAVVETRPGVQAISGTLQDVTERKIREQELIQSKKMESIGRLAGGIAHDFNNLLTIVNGYSELVLTRMKDADPLRNFVEEIRYAGVRAAELTQQLLAFSRRQTLQPVDLDLNAVIVETERLLAHLIAKNIQIITVLAPGLSKIRADQGQLTQVLLNLAVNARDAMPRGGRLTIETANVSRVPRGRSLPGAENPPENPVTFVRISVTDTGSGMDEETQKHLFEPFFTTKPRGSGTGLGLSTVYGIVRQSNGYINVQTEIGLGTRFDVYLPSSGVAASGKALEAQPPATSGVQLKGKTILVVDDQRAARKLVLTVLQASGYRTLEASNGEEALALLRERSYSIDLVLTDVVMPGISGRTLVERMRKIRPGTPAVLISGYTDDAMDSQVADAEFVFLQKPFSTQRLLELVEETLQMV